MLKIVESTYAIYDDTFPVNWVGKSEYKSEYKPLPRFYERQSEDRRTWALRGRLGNIWGSYGSHGQHCKGTNWYFQSGAMKHVTGDVTSMEDLCTIGSVSSVRSARGQIPPSSSKGKCSTHLQWRNKTHQRCSSCPWSHKESVVSRKYYRQKLFGHIRSWWLLSCQW